MRDDFWKNSRQGPLGSVRCVPPFPGKTSFSWSVSAQLLSEASQACDLILVGSTEAAL